MAVYVPGSECFCTAFVAPLDGLYLLVAEGCTGAWRIAGETIQSVPLTGGPGTQVSFTLKMKAGDELQSNSAEAYTIAGTRLGDEL